MCNCWQYKGDKGNFLSSMVFESVDEFKIKKMPPNSESYSKSDFRVRGEAVNIPKTDHCWGTYSHFSSAFFDSAIF